MGEIADAMLNGTLCAGCGAFLGTDQGFPDYCPGCEPDGLRQAKRIGRVKRAKDPARRKEGYIASPEPVPCTCGICGKRFASRGAKRQHRRAMHHLPGTVAPGLNNPLADSHADQGAHR